MEALRSCRRAGVRVAMMTGDNARTARAIASEIGLLLPGGVVVEGASSPSTRRPWRTSWTDRREPWSPG